MIETFPLIIPILVVGPFFGTNILENALLYRKTIHACNRSQKIKMVHLAVAARNVLIMMMKTGTPHVSNLKNSTNVY